MLAVGQLNQEEIAREAGVAPSTVCDVALGKRQAWAVDHELTKD